MICQNCKQETSEEDMTNFKGQEVCEGCAEGLDLYEHDDPTGRNWQVDDYPQPYEADELPEREE